MNSRFIFVLETEVHTHGRHFDASAPTAREVLEMFVNLKSKKRLPQFVYGDSEISISDVNIKGDLAVILFRLASDTIPDNRFLNKKTRAMRDAARQKDEAPAVSAHLVIDISSRYDQKRKYPTAIENARYLSKTIMLMAINRVLRENLSVSRKWTSKSGDQKNRNFTPRLAYHANYRNSINGMIDRNGAIAGIELIDEKIEEVTMGSTASPVTEKRELRIIPAKKPRGDAARDFIKGIFDRSEAASAKTAKIVIEDPEHGKPKVVKIDRSQTDLLKSAFIPQKKVTRITPSLKICEDGIHAGFVELMKSHL